MKYISKLGFSCSSHAANDSSKKLLSASMSQLHKTFLFSKIWMAGYIDWYIVIISAYYSLIIGPIGEDYLFSSIQYGWDYIVFVMIVIKVTNLFNVVVRIGIYCRLDISL